MSLLPDGALFAEHPLYAGAAASVIALGALSFLALLFVSAPYGRHARAGWGPAIPARWGWLLMEAPSPLGFAYVFWREAGFDAGAAPLTLFGLWQLHYLYRSFVFPFRMRGGHKPKPVLTVALAFAFNCANGPMNGYGAAHFAELGAGSGGSTAFLGLGVALFLLGWAINHWADAVLRRLRAPGETGYAIPRGGLYRFVSCPNYLGEILEWLGFAFAAGTFAALAFALFTVANLLPRALSHHRWYRAQFPEYPAERRALVPFVL